MPDQRRFDKTIEKTRGGELPAPTHDVSELSVGDGTPCDGCDETIEPRDQLRRINVRGVLRLRFQAICFSAWSAFKQ